MPPKNTLKAYPMFSAKKPKTHSSSISSDSAVILNADTTSSSSNSELQNSQESQDSQPNDCVIVQSQDSQVSLGTGTSSSLTSASSPSVVISSRSTEELPSGSSAASLTSASSSSSVPNKASPFSGSEQNQLVILSKLNYTFTGPSARNWKPYKAEWSLITPYVHYSDQKKPNGAERVVQGECPHNKLVERVHSTVFGKTVDRSKEGMAYAIVQVQDSPRVVLYCTVCHEMKSMTDKNDWSYGIWVTSKSLADE